MNKLPSDWNNDQELWEMLGKVRENRPSTNFRHMVHQKMAPRAVHQGWFSVFPSLSWVTRFAFAAATCGILLFAFVLIPEEKREIAKRTETSHPAPNVELAQLAQNFELIQDLEVIHNLDNL
jgi:hypothetical protein